MEMDYRTRSGREVLFWDTPLGRLAKGRQDLFSWSSQGVQRCRRGKIFFRGNWEGKSYEDKGTILEVDPPRLLRYDYWSNASGTADIPENYIVLTFELVESDGVTTITLSQQGAESEEARAHSEQNWSGGRTARPCA